MRLLFVDDQEENLKSLALGFRRSDYEILTALGGSAAIEILKENNVDVVVTDLKMPEVDGMQVLSHCASLTPPVAVIMITAFGTIESAVEALKAGAFDYITKPVNLTELRVQVEKACEHRRLQKENIYLHSEINKRYGFEGMIGQTGDMQQIFEKARLIAKSKATVLIEGESGTGKDLLARAIHYNSPRSRHPFMPIHCAALPETLLESELFGHEKGAFTGAIARKEGFFELAHNGTIFLDEVGEIPASMQVKLLRVLETKEFMRVGGVKPIQVDIRVICATNKNLAEEVEEGRFREDLFYRLNVITFHIPPLRNRRADIPLLVKTFVDEFARENGKTITSITKRAMAQLTSYHWPGNIRELRNCIESMVVFAQGEELDADALPEHLHPGAGREMGDFFSAPIGQTLDVVEKKYIQETLIGAEGNRTKAAETLGISRRTLQRKIKELGIESG
ncbi:MAG TPA: sigma-54 dependent transcriptional regulator [Candidatus Sumerlaeota bacterium]|nr:sigma-54 dependent transcriptional regulator [Candidatus Sumerlaeota bacterium]HRR31873.1 sigma-54 dependent transcriptional regulator [Candidatus Sumerlaeia bacterium]HON50196.1 sigma-54 dependent transcriptional regulator [Candidatus Sumerlaeota bacterium]HOR63412.1 sigma-54 dependent transcriptional regulator [Candidatus Sumerlaeota bacterium]HPL74163.1 sigma-54 dependent transcriptional regulator [Candidatus Sumerlaeota bacterium]